VAAVTGIESAYGVKDLPTAWEAAKATVQPTLMMTALMTPFAAAGTLLTARRKAQIAQTVATPPDPAQMTDAQVAGARNDRSLAALLIFREMRKTDKDGATAWVNEANAAIAADAPVHFDANFKYTEQPAVRPPESASELPGFHVDELPIPEAINIHTPDFYRPQTIDIHAPDEPSTHGYDVTEGTPAQEINVHVPEHYQDQTIDIHPPLQEEGSGGVKGGRGNQPTAEDVAARLEAARAEPGPGQGTARALGSFANRARS
jgi:hypothetical protein